MKNLLITIMLMAAGAAQAQNTGKYCEVKVFDGFKEYEAAVYYGDKPDNKKNFIKDKDGQKMEFTSKVAILNYMVAQGWQLVACEYHSSETHFYMKKE